MKKTSLLAIALAGATLAISAPGAFAATGASVVTVTPLPAGNPDVFNVSGTIEEFVQITAIDDQLELGNIGGAQLTGTAISISGAKNNGANTVPITKNTSSGATEGDARVEFKANTFLTIDLSSSDIKNAGPSTTVTTDDVTLPTFYRIAGRGNIRFSDNNNANLFTGNLPSNTATNTDGYASFSDTVPAANPTGLKLTYSPGAATNNPDPNAPSGLRIMAEITRKGLQDYKGIYSSAINLSYTKF